MSNKNPFEIRLETLTMAKEYLDRIHDVNTTFGYQAFEQAMKTGKATVEQWKEYTPTPYTFKEVIDKAQELYGFVNKKD